MYIKKSLKNVILRLWTVFLFKNTKIYQCVT